MQIFNEFTMQMFIVGIASGGDYVEKYIVAENLLYPMVLCSMYLLHNWQKSNWQ